MPINYQEVYTQIQTIGAGAKERKKRKEEAQARAREWFAAFDSQLDLLRSKVDSARAIDPNLRCAYPLDEPLASSFDVRPASVSPTLIAADGSQINPDRHAAVQFGLVNVGAIIMKMKSAEPPQIVTDSELLFGDDLLPNGIPMSDGMVALKRDLAERKKLDDLSKEIHGPVITFTDGPIELWGMKGDDPTSYEDFIEKYKGVLSRLQSRGVITAGYVDKPSADLVVRLLEIAIADNEQIQKLREFHPLRGVSDRWLYGERENPLLKPGHRSAVFKIQSSSEKRYTGVLSLHFFYLNVGTEGHPWPVRVEIPKWVADDREKLNLLQAVLVEQCRMMGSKPYPYLLNRAHEIAVVKNEEKQQIEQLLAMELSKQGEETDSASPKQTGKDSLASGRKRYGT
ncbi:MAG: DNA double-strand break repair nuclease NurA [Chloroflexi bacterium]|nr:DNA double-strand break repair nuclease NurA [Chloroflexota bacterium]